MNWFLSIFAIFVIAFLVLQFGDKNLAIIGGGDDSEDTTGSVSSNCPSTGLTNFELDIFNQANDTGSEAVDVTFYIFEKATNNLVTTITDTSNPNDTELVCGIEYVGKAISTSGASGDKSIFESVAGGNSKLVNGNIEFTTTNANLDLIAKVEQHASLGCRAYNNEAGAYMYDSSDSLTTEYETDGVTFTSITDNATATDETLGLDMTFKCKAVQSDTDYNDRGILVLLEMPTTKWDTPMVYVNGQVISEVTLTDNEADSYVDYEYAFLIPDSVVIKDGSQGIEVRVANQLKSGITSVTYDPQVDFAPRGSILSKSGLDVLVGVAVSDASTPAQVHTLFDITIDMT